MSEVFTKKLKSHDVHISMDGKGAWRDQIMVERLCYDVKYEEVYLNAYEDMALVKWGLKIGLIIITQNVNIKP